MATSHEDAVRVRRIGRKWMLTVIGWIALAVGVVLFGLAAGVLWVIGVPIDEIPPWVLVIGLAWFGVAVVLGMFCEPSRSDKYFYATTRHFEDQLDAATKTFDADFKESDNYRWDDQIAELSGCSREELIGRLLALREHDRPFSYVSGRYYWAGFLEQIPNNVFTNDMDMKMGAMREIQRKLQ